MTLKLKKFENNLIAINSECKYNNTVYGKRKKNIHYRQ